VLVIIGLIIGGVLTGRDLINAALIRQQMTQLEQFAAAVNTYRTKYNNLPGDDPNALTFGLGPAGDGNGIIEFFHGIVTMEGHNAWAHLANAGLIQGPYTAGSCAAGVGFPRPKMHVAQTLTLDLASGFAMLTADYTGWDGGGRNIWVMEEYGS